MAEKVAVAPKVKQQPAHVGYSCVHPEQMGGSNVALSIAAGPEI
jgi:hypothetical protein